MLILLSKKRQNRKEMDNGLISKMMKTYELLIRNMISIIIYWDFVLENADGY
jgi:hypothetical protein